MRFSLKAGEAKFERSDTEVATQNLGAPPLRSAASGVVSPPKGFRD